MVSGHEKKAQDDVYALLPLGPQFLDNVHYNVAFAAFFFFFFFPYFFFPLAPFNLRDESTLLQMFSISFQQA